MGMRDADVGRIVAEKMGRRDRQRCMQPRVRFRTGAMMRFRFGSDANERGLKIQDMVKVYVRARLWYIEM